MNPFPVNLSDNRAYLLQAVEEISPILRENATKNEELGTITPPVVQSLQESGMFKLKLAADFGGAEADPVLQMEVLEALAYHDLTAAWVTMVGTTGISVLGAFMPEPGLKRIFENGVPRASVMPAPTGKAIATEGGYRVTGHWRFNSGVKHAEWAAVGAIAENQDGSKEQIIMGLPLKDVTIHENWDVVALQGTGSCDFTVDDYFLPAELTHPFSFTDPQPQRGGPMYAMPWAAYVSNEHACVVLGAAQRALDELIQEATTTRSAYRPSKLDSRHVVHRFVGEAHLKLHAARALLHNRYRELWTAIQDGHKLTPIELNELRSLGTFCTDTAVEIVTQVFRYGGAKALFAPNIFERLLRDVNAAGQHFAVGDQTLEDYGRNLLGLD